MDRESTSPILIADYRCEIGENPLWHAIEKKLYWTDIPAGRLFRYDPVSARHEQCYQGRPVGGFTVQQDGSLLLFMDRGTVAAWKDGSLHELIPEIADERASRFNDVIADPRGRVFCGTMPTEERRGRLYRLDLDGSLHLLLEEIGTPNGMAFTLDHKGFYFTDSLAHTIYLFDYDEETGAISKRRVSAQFSDAEGFPDGATVDAEGKLWTALWDGSCIVRLAADGSVEERFTIPARKASSLTFGGSDSADIYVTTAGGNARDVEGELAGSLFRVDAGTQGLPEFFSRVARPVPISN